MIDGPLAYFITWTVYGTHLPGDLLGWRQRGHGHQLPRPQLAKWHEERLLHPIELLSRRNREATVNAINEICCYRNWKLWNPNIVPPIFRSSEDSNLVSGTNTPLVRRS